MTTVISEDDGITLPHELVRELGWQPGTRLDWQRLDDNSILVRPVCSRADLLRSVKGLVKPRPDSDPITDLQKIQEEEDRTLL
jgi:antitoxin component of MazEF toxin-antitoxin module